MRRTPLNRKVSMTRTPMPPRRSRLRKVSKTNSQPHRNVSLRDEYREQNPLCEVYPYLKDFMRINLPGGVVVPMKAVQHETIGIHLHHIFSMGSRPDYWGNMICIGQHVHALRHDWIPAEITVACLYAKWRKGGRDWNPDELKVASGQDVYGYLQYANVVGQYDAMRLRILHQETP